MAESVARDRRGGELAGNLDTSFLKVLALCFMFIDHLGAAVLPRVGELRMIGRPCRCMPGAWWWAASKRAMRPNMRFACWGWRCCPSRCT